MNIGFMMLQKKPRIIVKTTALIASNFGFRIVYFTPNDIDFSQGKVNGKVYVNNKWKKIKVDIPKLIDVHSRCYKRETRDKVEKLKEHSVLTFDRTNTPSKEKLQQELLNDKNFKHIVIPTKRLESYDCLLTFLEKHSRIIVKPLFGRQGMEVYKIELKDQHYLLSYDTTEKQLNQEELYNFYKESLGTKKFILQKFIDSTTINGDPFDCRSIVQKNRQGKWEIAQILVRTGIGQKVVSNTHQGGGISYPKKFLKANFGDKWKVIYKNLKKLSVQLPYKIEEIKQTPTMDLGLDIGIDKSGDLYLFESNNGAGINRLVAESAILRVEYYQYLIETTPLLQKEYKHNKLLPYNELKKENVKLLKMINEIKNSSSWRITKPLRKLKNLLNKIK